MLVHYLQMTVPCGNHVYIVHDGMERKKAMPSMMLSLKETSFYYSVKRWTL